MTCTADSGTCDVCRSACSRRPGWFLPGEVERTAELLGISLTELFATRLNVDYWYADHRLSPTTFVLVPNSAGSRPGQVLTLNGHTGRCTFLTDDGRCEIHEAKPFECRQWYCGADESKLTPHVDVATVWRWEQGQIADLLGHEPELPPVTLLDLFDLAMGAIDDVDPLGAQDEAWQELRTALREVRDEA